MVKCWACCSSEPKVSSPRHEQPTNSSPKLSSPTHDEETSVSSPSPSIESMKLIIQQLPQTDPADQIDPLIEFVDYLLRRIKASPEEASSSSFSLDSVASYTELGANIIDKISTEAQKFEDVFKEIGNVALTGLKVVGEAHWLLLGLSVVAHALERCEKVRSNVSGCMELLQKIASLAKDLKQFREVMPGERDRLCEGVQIIVEGAVMCCGYIGKGKIRRYWSASTANAQLEKTNQSIRDIRDSLNSTVNMQTLRQNTFRSEQSPLELLDFKPVGIESQVAEVTELLDMEGTEPALAVVLCGFGGVGKSTIAASAIQSLNWPKLKVSPDFKFSSVKINHTAQNIESHIIDLQQYIITDIGGKKLDLRSSDDGRNKLQKVMENKFCFLYIDNVVDKEHFGLLLPNLLRFNESNMSLENSEKRKTKVRILVTSREKNLKPKFNFNCKEYEVHAFSDEAAELLLRKTILQSQSQFSLDFDERGLMTSVARACRGVPLVLSVFGNHLRTERDEGAEIAERSYREAIEALREGNLDIFTDEDISGKLFFVYRKLRDEEEKDAFLDICKYFYGWEWNLVANIVDPSRLESLHRRMLINKSESGEVTVHDILRLMGVKEAKHTRISSFEEFCEVFEDVEANLKTVKGISLVSDKSVTKLETRHLDAVCQSLRVLMIGDWVNIDGPPCNKAFTKLRYLSLGDAIDFPFADDSKLQKLAAFFNRSKHGMNLHRLPRSLKVISHEVADPDLHSFEILALEGLDYLQNLIVKTRKLVEVPKELHLPASLVDLQLNCCSRLPTDFSNLTALQNLILDKCDLESLPKGFGKLKKLKHLSLEHCTKLTSLPEELGLLSSLSSLRLRSCSHLEKLPVDLGKLSAMEELSMGECENLRELPHGFGGLSSLQKLDLTGCISLERLPESFEKLPIESLTLQSLPNLNELPESIGNMPSLTHLKLISCNSLTTLPNSFVQLSLLESLQIDECNKLVALPRDFGQLSSLNRMIVRHCRKLQELPHAFQALPTLKSFRLMKCPRLQNLPAGFGELKLLETLIISTCLNLETLPDDFESLASLTRLHLLFCPNLDGRAMERIVKLKFCYSVTIKRSPKLIERWGEMRKEGEYPMVVVGGMFSEEEEDDVCRATRVGLLGARCVEVDSTTQQLMERSTSILFEVDTIVAVIGVPVPMEDHQHRLIQRLVGVTMEKAKMASSGRLQIVYVKMLKLYKGETTVREKQEEEDCFRQILMSTPVEGSCAIPSADLRCHRLITDALSLYNSFRNKLDCRMLKMRVDDKGNKILEFFHSFGEDDISGEPPHSSESTYEENKISNSIGNFIDNMCAKKLPGPTGLPQFPHKESMLTEFLQILKENNADYLVDSKLNKVELDRLKGNMVGIFICDRNTAEYVRLQQIYKEVKDKGFKFEVLWIPLCEHEFYGHGTYTRALGTMAWIALRNPNVVKVEKREPHFIIFDQEGRIDNPRALSAMMLWGTVAYPFTKSKINEILSIRQSDFSVNFLFHKLNLVSKETIKNKLFFLYAEPPSQKMKMASKLEQLAQLHGEFEIIYMGNYFLQKYDRSTFKNIYESVIQKMNWYKLSFEDMVTFWYHCKCLSEEMEDQSNVILGELKMLPNLLYFEKRWLVVIDGDDIVTRSGYEMVKMMCKINDEKRDGVGAIMEKELLKSLKVGKCNGTVKTFFKDIINHPKHLHPLTIESRIGCRCDVCDDFIFLRWYQKRQYRCQLCDWDLCEKCWKLFVKRQVQN